MNKTIRMFAVEDSSNIAAVGYLADEGGKDAGTLRVRFSSGATYDYAGVGLDVLSAFQNAPSMGSYLAKRIKGQFVTTKLAELPAPPKADPVRACDGCGAAEGQPCRPLPASMGGHGDEPPCAGRTSSASTAPKALMDVVGPAVLQSGPADARWTLVDTSDHRPGSATGLPIDVPEGRRVRIMAVMVEVTDGRGFPPDPVTPQAPAAHARLTSPESPVAVVAHGSRRALGGGVR